MDHDQPCAKAVDQLMQDVGISDAVHGRVDCKGEEEDVGYQPQPTGDTRDHVARTHGLDDEDIRHDGEDVVMR